MQNVDSLVNVAVTWRGNKYNVEVDSHSSLKDLGDELLKLTGIRADTMRIIVPQFTNKGSKLLYPFSDEHAPLSLTEAHITEGKIVRMMGVSEVEVDKVLENAKVDLRIAGFDEEEKRIRQRSSYRTQRSIQLPQGPYIFCDFHTLQLPGIELNPPASEALKRMHMLASDPGIVAIMNKHRWRVGIMTEMAPVGYVGVSPKCILGFNKNHGEEISLRLRTDDLKGFRKYEVIKKTLLHELAHMVYSEHDANFYALDRQLNQEADSLDWTKSRGHTLSRYKHEDNYEEDLELDSINTPQKLGGSMLDPLASARASSVAAAYWRLANASSDGSVVSEVLEEPDPDDAMHISLKGNKDIQSMLAYHEPDPDENLIVEDKYEPDRDEHPLDESKDEPDPDDSRSDQHQVSETSIKRIQPRNITDEPDPDDERAAQRNLEEKNTRSQDTNVFLVSNNVLQSEPDPDGHSAPMQEISSMQIDEPDPDDQELERIQEPVVAFCHRLQQAIEVLRAGVDPTEAASTLQVLFKIIRNVIEHPNEVKFRRLRKANPIIQKNIANKKAAMDLLQMIGFEEEITQNRVGTEETYLVLKRNDPGLLWLAKSSLEAYDACRA